MGNVLVMWGLSTVRSSTIGRRVFPWSFQLSGVSIPNISQACQPHLTPGPCTPPPPNMIPLSPHSFFQRNPIQSSAIHVSTISEIWDSREFSAIVAVIFSWPKSRSKSFFVYKKTHHYGGLQWPKPPPNLDIDFRFSDKRTKEKGRRKVLRNV